jgi:Sec-independent protein translocase protein TatA
MGVFDGAQLNNAIILIVVILLFIFGSTDLKDLKSAP